MLVGEVWFNTLKLVNQAFFSLKFSLLSKYIFILFACIHPIKLPGNYFL